MKKFITNKYVLYVLGVIFFILIWEVISLIVHEPILVFPDPITTFIEGFKLLGSSYFYKCLGATLLRMVTGFLLALGIAMLLGILIGNNKKIQAFLTPGMTITKAIPTAALVLLFLTLLHSDKTPAMIVLIMSLPILYESIIGGVNAISKEVEDTTKLEELGFIHANISIRLPQAIPSLMVGISSSLAMSFKIAIMSEVIAGTTTVGLGSQIRYLQANETSMVPVFAYSFMAILFVLIFDFFFMLLKNKFKEVKRHS